MDKSENNAINWSLLTTSTIIHPRKLEGEIIAPTGEKRGEWTAHICNDAHYLCRHLNLSPDEITLVEKIHPEVWPLAYLNSITVSEKHRDSNFGSVGLASFLAMAVEHNCRIALVRIGWSESSPMAKNLHFYLKNGWTELFSKDSNSTPIDLPLSFYDLSSVL
jgi:hypothetical protein